MLSDYSRSICAWKQLSLPVVWISVKDDMICDHFGGVSSEKSASPHQMNRAYESGRIILDKILLIHPLCLLKWDSWQYWLSILTSLSISLTNFQRFDMDYHHFCSLVSFFRDHCDCGSVYKETCMVNALVTWSYRHQITIRCDPAIDIDLFVDR